MSLADSILVFAGLGSLACLAVRLLWLRRLRRKFRDRFPTCFPTDRSAPLSPTELDFYKALERSLGGRDTVCMKVRLADVIECPRAVWHMGYGRLIAQKHLDFVLIDPATTRIRAAIELDDRSHTRLPDRRARDRFVEAAMRAAGVPLVRLPAATRHRSARGRPNGQEGPGVGPGGCRPTCFVCGLSHKVRSMKKTAAHPKPARSCSASSSSALPLSAR